MISNAPHLYYVTFVLRSYVLTDGMFQSVHKSRRLLGTKSNINDWSYVKRGLIFLKKDSHSAQKAYVLSKS